MRRFQLKPGIAAYMGVTELTSEKPTEVSAIFLSHARGVVVGLHNNRMDSTDWPLKVRAEINKHFGTVFALSHEDWMGRGPSPRVQYLDSLQPWIVEAPDE